MQKALASQYQKTNMSKKFQENALQKMKSAELVQDLGNIRSAQNQSDRLGTMNKLDKKGEKQSPLTMVDNSMENSFVDKTLIKDINSQNTTQEQPGLQFFQQ